MSNLFICLCFFIILEITLKKANLIRITVFCKDGDSCDQVKHALVRLVPFDVGKEKVPVTEKTATGFEEKKIRIIEIVLVKDRHCNAFLESIRQLLSDAQRTLIINQIETRLDDDLDFFLRLEKDSWLRNEIRISDSGNCFHVKVSLASFPKKREVARELVRGIFG